MTDFTNKPNIVSDPIEGPFFVVQSPDGSKSMVLGLTNEGDLTVDGKRLTLDDAEGETETTYNANSQLTHITNWNKSVSPFLKIKEEELTWTDKKISQVTTKYYDSTGGLLKTITETIAYKGNGQIQDITRTIT